MTKMHTRWRWLALLLACVGCSQVPLGSGKILTTPPKQLLSRQVIVALPGQEKAQWQAIHKRILDQFDMQPVGQFPLTSINVNCLVYRVSDMVDIDEVVRRLSNDPQIALVQHNQPFEGMAAGQQADYNALAYAPKMLGLDQIRKFATGKGVKVAIIDTGVDIDHPELRGKVMSKDNFVEGGWGSFKQDRHGTAIAGIIAASLDQQGVDGVAPEASLEVYKACWYANPQTDKATCSSWTLAKALDTAINAGARIINMSLAGSEDQLLAKLLDAAERKNVVVVAATKENASSPGFPASLETVLSVVSATPAGSFVKPSWDLGKPVFIAPGTEILTITPQQGYGFFSGSSMATAHLTGVIALLLEHQKNIKPSKIREILADTPFFGAKHKGVALRFTWVDACHAMAKLDSRLFCN